MRAYLFRIENQSNVEISNVKCVTPESDITGDMIIRVNDCANISFKDIVINGSYSHIKKSGYGISMNNVYNVSFYRLFANANWGIFGNNNVNNVKLKECDINRFDVHCYGKDVSFENCVFSRLYNQFSSIYGDVKFDRCIFTSFTPVLIDPSFNAYTPFNVSWSNCEFNMDEKHNFLIYLYGLSEDKNQRPELSRKSIPNVSVKNCTINVTAGVKNVNVIETGTVKYNDPIDYITKIDISEVMINGGVPQVNFFSQRVKTSKKLKLIAKKVKAAKYKNKIHVE